MYDSYYGEGFDEMKEVEVQMGMVKDIIEDTSLGIVWDEKKQEDYNVNS